MYNLFDRVPLLFWYPELSIVLRPGGAGEFDTDLNYGIAQIFGRSYAGYQAGLYPHVSLPGSF